ncbi:MAG: ADP-ribosylglycohydrolase family protein [Kouleothrix sp.]
MPYEFHAPSELPPYAALSICRRQQAFGVPTPRFRPAILSDDGAQALALLASLACGKLDLMIWGGGWWPGMIMATLVLDRVVFDVGIQTAEAIRALKAGAAHVAGPRHERANGNGSLMRVLLLALWASR